MKYWIKVHKQMHKKLKRYCRLRPISHVQTIVPINSNLKMMNCKKQLSLEKMKLIQKISKSKQAKSN